jgi:DNA-3-methyladenine glycosylase
MVGPPGYAYVFRVYRVHCCLNVVTGPAGRAGAVLFRALAPVQGIEAMRQNRGRDMPDTNLTSGPGKLTQALAIGLDLHGADFCGHELCVEDRCYSASGIRAGPRVGIAYAGEWARRPLRFWEEGCEFVSAIRRQA